MTQTEIPAALPVALPASGAHGNSAREPDRTYVLEARQLGFQRGRRTVLQRIDLAVAPGEAVALLGANGAGKTTLLQCLAGALRPMSGEVRWCGEPAAQKAALRRRIGFVGHESGLYSALTCWENLLFAGRLFGVEAVTERLTQLLRTTDLASHAHQRVAHLSRGMRQRLAIVRATIHQPDIVLLDEPCTSLDADGRRWLASYLRELRARRCGLVFSTHDVAYARTAAERTLLLHSGQLRVWEDGNGDISTSDDSWSRSKT